MKTRDSGMPDEAMWETFFDPPAMLRALSLNAACRDVAEFGCGYGTFTIPAARIVSGRVHAFDIEAGLVQNLRRKCRSLGIGNVSAVQRDFVLDGTGLADATMDYAMLFNILHAEEPIRLLEESFRILRKGAVLAVVHWIHDPGTPRGPAIEIRPRPEQCVEWAQLAGFETSRKVIGLPPYHYGLTFEKI